jgi:hypothetical protein
MNKLKTISAYYKVRTFIFTIVLLLITSLTGCQQGTNKLSDGAKAFWGDSAAVFIANLEIHNDRF